MATLSAQFRRRTACLAAALGVLLAASAVAAPAAKANDVLTSPVAVAETYAKPTVPGALVPVTPFRALDTRTSVAVRPDGTVSFQAGGAHGIPAKVSAVTFNLTVTEPRLIGFITAYASGTQRPGSSNVNFLAGQTVANSVTVPVGADGKVTLFNRSYGTTHLIADVSGYYLPGVPDVPGAFVPTEPSRFLDTRTSAAVRPDGSVSFQAGGAHGIPAKVSAVTFNLTVTEPRLIGFITAYASGTQRPGSSNVNFLAGQTVANSVTVPVGADGKVTLFNRSYGTTHLIADVSGYYLPGVPDVPGAFVPTEPSRFLDTRTSAAVRPDGSVSFQAGGAHGIPAKVSAVTFNLTVTEPRLIGFITAYASGTQRPGSSNVNFLPGQTVANSVTVPVGADGKVTLFNRSYGTTHLIADVSGYYLPGASRNSALTWGDNRFSQLGNGTTPYRSTPAAVSGLRGVKALAGAGGTSYALLSDGTLRAWGSNEYGQLGNGTTSSSTTPVQVSGLTGVTSIAADWSTAYALLKDGTVRSWGSNTSGELGNGSVYASSSPVQVKGLTGVTALTAGSGAAYALLKDGTVRSWGYNWGGQLGNGTTANSYVPVQVKGLTGVRSIAVGSSTAYALLNDGTVRAWGFDNGGQLGNGGGADDGRTPVQVQGLTGVTTLTADGGVTYALLKDGTVRAWGYGSSGQLGNGTTGNSNVPVQVKGLNAVASITAGGGTAYARLLDGTVRAWGGNWYGQLGNGTTGDSNVPVEVDGLTGVSAVTAAIGTAYALLNDGTIRAWGGNRVGQLGNGTHADRNIPGPVKTISGATSITATAFSVFTLLADGTVRAWGDNYDRQLGVSGTAPFSSLPVGISGLSGVAMAAQGAATKYALLADGTVWAWGSNSYGQLGSGMAIYDSSVPVRVRGITGAVSVMADGGTAYALLADGTVLAWGENSRGQLGNGTTTDSSTPVPVQGLAGVSSITASNGSAYARLLDGTVRAWGGNQFGQLGDGTTERRSIPVQAKGLSGVTSLKVSLSEYVVVYAVLGDGTVRAWGSGTSGELGNGTMTDSTVPVQVTGLAGVASIATGKGTAYALLKDGTVRVWGSGGYGQLGNGTNDDAGTPIPVKGIIGATSIAAGESAAYALLRDGTVRAWGNNRLGELGDGTTGYTGAPVQVKGLTGVTSITVNGRAIFALMSDKSVRAWGAGPHGQLGNGTTAGTSTPVEVPGLAGVTSLWP